MNRQAQQYHNNMTKLFNSPSQNSDSNIKRHFAHLERMENEKKQSEEEKKQDVLLENNSSETTEKLEEVTD